MRRTISILIFTIFSSICGLNAQVFYNHYNITLDKNSSLKSIELDIFKDGIIDARIEFQETASGDVFRFFTGSKTFVVSDYHHSVQVVKAFEQNDLMDGQWIKSNGGYVMYSEVQNIGLFDSDKDYFIAVRLQRDGKFHIGWINVRADFSKAYPSFTILSSAVKQSSGGLMYAGDFISSVSETNIKKLEYTLINHNLHIQWPTTMLKDSQLQLNIFNLQGQLVYNRRIYIESEISLPLQLKGNFIIVFTNGDSNYFARINL